MKTITNNLKYFGGFTLLFSIIFFYNLYSAIANQSYDNIWIYATLYGMALFICGFVLGYNDPVQSSRHDLGFQYHLITFVVVNGVGIVSLFSAMGLSWTTFFNAILSIIFWGLGLLVHYFFSTKTIKGLDKDEIFD